MKLAITIYPDDFAQADRIIHLLSQERGLELDGYMGKQHYDRNFDRPTQPVTSSGSAIDQDEIPNDPRPNVCPGEPSIGKIGSKSRDEILINLKNNMQPDLSYYAEHCKLLWKRGEIRFDGDLYYL